MCLNHVSISNDDDDGRAGGGSAVREQIAGKKLQKLDKEEAGSQIHTYTRGSYDAFT